MTLKQNKQSTFYRRPYDIPDHGLLTMFSVTEINDFLWCHPELQIERDYLPVVVSVSTFCLIGLPYSMQSPV